MSMFDNNYNSGANTFSGSQVGGGFMNDNNENFNTSNKMGGGPGQPRGGVIPYEKRTLSQITIKQIQTAKPPQPESNLVVDNVEISQICMMAQIQSIDIQSSHTTLTLNDCSGSIQAKKWTNDNQAPEDMNLIEGQWVRIFGRINHYAGRCSINVFDIIPITNYNDITHHFLECIYAHLYNTVGAAEKQKQAMNNNNNNNTNNNNQYNNMNTNYGSNNGMNVDTNNSWNQQNSMRTNNNLSTLENMILNIINAPEYEHNDAGCSVETIFQQLPNENIDNIRTSIDKLSDEGYIYSTVDEEHYKYSGDQQ